MTFRILGGTLFALLTMAAVSASTRAQEPQASTSVNDGVYTEEQARRGEAMYGEFCASCHGPALSGGEMAPPLVGGDFASSWVGLSLNDLFERMRISMPQNKPGSLSRQQNADILAFMLASGKYPVGNTELAKENEVLKTIKFEAPK